jgi:hypothetical protein
MLPSNLPLPRPSAVLLMTLRPLMPLAMRNGVTFARSESRVRLLTGITFPHGAAARVWLAVDRKAREPDPASHSQLSHAAGAAR